MGYFLKDVNSECKGNMYMERQRETRISRGNDEKNSMERKTRGMVLN